MIRRSYSCDVCVTTFEIVCEKDDPDPDCPQCAYVATRDLLAEAEKDRARLQAIIDSGRAPAVLTNKSRAMDFAQEMAEKDYGLTDMKDNTRPGEAHFKADAPMSTSEAEQRAREYMAIEAAQPVVTPLPGPLQALNHHQGITDMDPVRNFWNAGGAVQGAPSSAGPLYRPQDTMPQASEARNSGNDPMEMLHTAGKAGHLPVKHDVIGRAPIPEQAA